MDPKCKRMIVRLGFGVTALLGMSGAVSFAGENASIPNDPEIERTRQEIKMLDALFKNVIVLVDETYVKKPSDVAAATAG